MSFRCRQFFGLLFIAKIAFALDCKDKLEGKLREYSSISPRVFTETSKSEIEKTFLELVQQTGLNPKRPDLRRIRDGSKFYLVIPAKLDTESGVLHLTYEIYHFENNIPKAVVSEVEFISEAGQKVSIERNFHGEQLTLDSSVQIENGYTLFASLEGDIVKEYMNFMRPFASSKMSDGSMIPAHSLRALAGARTLRQAYNLRYYARFINLKNFFVEACKRYGLYTLLGLTGIRQFFIILSRDRTEDRDEENEKLRQELNALLAEKKELQISLEQFLKLDLTLRQAGREIFEDERGAFYILKKVGNHYEALVEGDPLPMDGTYVENTRGRYLKVRSLGTGRILLEQTKAMDFQGNLPQQDR